MASTYSLAPNPHWVVIDNFSKLPAGAVIYTFSSLNPSVFKPAYEDAGGTIPFGQPIQGLGNGTFPPIFWKFDSSNPQDLYDIEVWTGVQGVDSTAELLWEFSGLTGTTSGGGGTITTNLDLDNLVINGQFFRNIGNQAGTPSLGNAITLAPSNHDGFCGVENSAGNDGPPSPDIIFAKNIGTEADSIFFTNFTNGDDFFGATPTPQQFVRYVSDAAGTSNYKYIQFPLVKGLQNLQSQNISVQMWNKLNSGSNNIKLSLRQFFGNGSNAPNPDVITDLTVLNLSAGNWLQTKVTSVLVPSIAGLTIGNCGNDALFLQIRFPASEAIDLSFILPAVYIGNTTSQVDFHTLDYVDSITNSPRTGDIRTSINSFSPYGWVPANDGTIGSATSGATTRNNIDTFPLYDLIWNSISNSLAPVVGGRGVSSIADFSANKPMFLTRNLGRVMAGALPVSASQTFVRAANTLVVASTAGFYTGMAVTVNVTGGGLTSGIIYYAIVVDSVTLSLATTTANALAGTVIVLGAVPNGTIVSVNVETLGSYIGEERHLMITSDLPANIPVATTTLTNLPGGGGQTLIGISGAGTSNIQPVGGGVPFNIIQPTVFMNVFIKL